MSMAMGELAVKVDGQTVYSYKQSGATQKPSDAQLLKLVVPS